MPIKAFQTPSCLKRVFDKLNTSKNQSKTYIYITWVRVPPCCRDFRPIGESFSRKGFGSCLKNKKKLR